MLSAVLLTLFQAGNFAQITVQPNQILHRASPHLFGIFFEEINCAGDGGLYPELIKNRSFEQGFSDWRAIPDGKTEVIQTSPSSHALKVKLDGPTTIYNHGFWGMNLRKGQKYRLTIKVKHESPLHVDAHLRQSYVLENTRQVGALITALPIKEVPPQQETVTYDFLGTGTPSSCLRLSLNGTGYALIDAITLQPMDNEKPQLFRPDLLEKLAGLQPKFMRFPGGCWVEGETMATAYRWKQTVGDPLSRPEVKNLWNYTSTNGLGFHEYLLLCERLRTEPLFVINCGMSHQQVVPMSDMDAYVQDALDAIEYANGPIDSKWGSLRARNGHPKPFNLKFMEIGNENGGPNYAERYPLFVQAIKAKYPQMRLIADVWGGYPSNAPVELIDEHYYNNPAFFIANADRYDSYDRKGPKIYVGEYAVTQGCGNGNLIAAVAEAAFMTGMERNSDHVVMASYAPLFANLNLRSWNPDLIYFNSETSYGTPSYQVQKLFSQNQVDSVVATQVSQAPSESPKFPTGGVGIGTWNTQAEFKDVTVIGASDIKVGPWTTESGTFVGDGGVTRQTSNAEPARSFAPVDAERYTVRLKARRLSGAEGFLITVGRKDSGNYVWFNVGGWGNSEHGIEWSNQGGKTILNQVRGSVETGRWYDVEVRYSPSEIVCLLDGKVIFDEKPKSLPSLHVSAGLAGKDLVVKAVNSGSKPLPVKLSVGTYAKGTLRQITSGSPLDENSLLSPHKVAPTQENVWAKNGTVTRTLPAYSVSVFRLVKGKS